MPIPSSPDTAGLFPYGETVTRLRATAVVDEYSGEATGTSWDTPDELDIPGCAFDPGTSTEPLEVGRTAVITQPRVFVPFGADILPGDRVVVRERTWEVDGDVAEWRSPYSGWTPGTEVRLKAVEG
jgi:hypothetical protein